MGLRKFHKGNVVFYYFPNQAKPNEVIEGPHAAVCLHSDTKPGQIVALCPVSSLHRGVAEKSIPPFCVILRQSDYPELECDSFIKVDHIITVDRRKVSPHRTPFTLLDRDSVLLDMGIMTVLEMADTVNGLVAEEVRAQLEDAAEAVDQALLGRMVELLSPIFRETKDRVEAIMTGAGVDDPELVRSYVRDIGRTVLEAAQAVVAASLEVLTAQREAAASDSCE